MRDLELFSTGSTYHVYDRGADKRLIFMDEPDRARFVRSLAAFNEIGRDARMSLSRHTSTAAPENPCVDVVAYCLMSNHFHLMLRQLVPNGISEFMRRLAGGYARYFNKRHGRTGTLFEGAYKVKRLTTTLQFRHLSRYIHLNPLELAGMDYKRDKVPWDSARRFLESYAWSSYRHYAGLETQPFVKNDEALTHIGDEKDYIEFLRCWMERDWDTDNRFHGAITR